MMIKRSIFAEGGGGGPYRMKGKRIWSPIPEDGSGWKKITVHLGMGEKKEKSGHAAGVKRSRVADVHMINGRGLRPDPL